MADETKIVRDGYTFKVGNYLSPTTHRNRRHAIEDFLDGDSVFEDLKTYCRTKGIDDKFARIWAWLYRQQRRGVKIVKVVQMEK